MSKVDHFDRIQRIMANKANEHQLKKFSISVSFHWTKEKLDTIITLGISKKGDYNMSLWD